MRWLAFAGLSLLLVPLVFAAPGPGSNTSDAGQLTVTLDPNQPENSWSDTEEVYLGLVGRGHGVSNPVIERTVSTDTPWTATVLPGEYRVVCASTHKGLFFSEVFRVQSGGRTELVCAWPRMSPYQGCIIDRQGRRLPGATIGPAALFDQTMHNALSPLGTKVARRALSAETDSSGCFRLRSPPGSMVDLWIESPGYIPARLNRFKFPPGGDTPQTLGELEVGPAGTPLDLTLHYD